MYIITGASDNHFQSLLHFLKSVPSHQIGQTFVWDLGLSSANLESLHNAYPRINYRRFPYEEYPAWFCIDVNAGEYAWKPVAIWRTALEVKEGVLLWCDAGNRLGNNLDSICEIIQRQGVYSPISAGTVRKWTHPGCLYWFGISDMDSILERWPRNGAIVGFDVNQGAAWRFLEEWAALAQQKDCIAPEGSSRENHRQDQAVLTILYYKFTNGASLVETNIGILTHQDCD
jgi:hypothetical protein